MVLKEEEQQLQEKEEDAIKDIETLMTSSSTATKKRVIPQMMKKDDAVTSSSSSYDHSKQNKSKYDEDIERKLDETSSSSSNNNSEEKNGVIESDKYITEKIDKLQEDETRTTTTTIDKNKNEALSSSPSSAIITTENNQHDKKQDRSSAATKASPQQPPIIDMDIKMSLAKNVSSTVGIIPVSPGAHHHINNNSKIQTSKQKINSNMELKLFPNRRVNNDNDEQVAPMDDGMKDLDLQNRMAESLHEIGSSSSSNKNKNNSTKEKKKKERFRFLNSIFTKMISSRDRGKDENNENDANNNINKTAIMIGNDDENSFISKEANLSILNEEIESQMLMNTNRQQDNKKSTHEHDSILRDSSEGSESDAYAIQGRASGETPHWSSRQSLSQSSSLLVVEDKNENSTREEDSIEEDDKPIKAYRVEDEIDDERLRRVVQEHERFERERNNMQIAVVMNNINNITEESQQPQQKHYYFQKFQQKHRILFYAVGTLSLIVIIVSLTVLLLTNNNNNSSKNNMNEKPITEGTTAPSLLSQPSISPTSLLSLPTTMPLLLETPSIPPGFPPKVALPPGSLFGPKVTVPPGSLFGPKVTLPPGSLFGPKVASPSPSMSLSPSMLPSISMLPTSLPSTSILPSSSSVPTTIVAGEIGRIIETNLSPSSSLSKNAFNVAQNKAFSWILEHVTEGSIINIADEDKILLLYSLAVLFYATDGNDWNRRDNWLDISSTHVCEWYGVIRCFDDQILELDLSNNNLKGSIPDEIALLGSIESIDLANNKINGISVQLASLSTSLTSLWIHDNELTGHVPKEVNELMQSNQKKYIDGIFEEIPMVSRSAIFIYGTPQYKAFQTTVYHTEKGIFTLNEKGFLQRYVLLVLYFSTNGDKWKRNDGWSSFENHCNWGWRYMMSTAAVPPNTRTIDCNDDNEVESLVLIDNNLNGTIPIELGALKSLTRLVFSGNSMTGSIPIELAALTQLRMIHLTMNGLTKEIPSEIGHLTELVQLILSTNDLTGKIPTELGQLKKLNTLFLSDNDLRGTIPEELGQLKGLWYMKLYHNDLSGSLPRSFCTVPWLIKPQVDCDEVVCECCLNSQQNECL